MSSLFTHIHTHIHIHTYCFYFFFLHLHSQWISITEIQSPAILSQFFSLKYFSPILYYFIVYTTIELVDRVVQSISKENYYTESSPALHIFLQDGFTFHLQFISSIFFSLPFFLSVQNRATICTIFNAQILIKKKEHRQAKKNERAKKKSSTKKKWVRKPIKKLCYDRKKNAL